MMKAFYISFGQIHVHKIAGKIFDKNCLAEIMAKDWNDAHEKAMMIFNRTFATVYEEPDLKYFPRGIIKVEEP